MRQVTGQNLMGKRIHDKAEFYVRRGRCKPLLRLLKKHQYLFDPRYSYLIYEAMWHNRKMLRWLLSNGLRADSLLAGNTPLMSAAADGDLMAIELLLQFGANVNARNEENEVPLGYACSWKQWQAAELLIDNGADVNAIENEGKTHLDGLILSGETTGAALLRSYGAFTYQELESQKGM